MTPARQQSIALETLEHDGRVWFRQAVSKADLMALDNLVHLYGRPGQRLSLTALSHRTLGPQSDVGRIAAAILPKAQPVRLVAFDKGEENNWSLPWHQDRVIAVKNRTEVSGFSNWSNKAGQWHCEAPVKLLRQMLFVRVHLDDTSETNGAMEIALGSHQFGPVRASDAANIASSCAREICSAERGDVLILNMLALHRSLRADDADRRRAIRIDYAGASLPPPLEWASEIR